MSKRPSRSCTSRTKKTSDTSNSITTAVDDDAVVPLIYCNGCSSFIPESNRLNHQLACSHSPCNSNSSTTNGTRNTTNTNGGSRRSARLGNNGATDSSDQRSGKYRIVEEMDCTTNTTTTTTTTSSSTANNNNRATRIINKSTNNVVSDIEQMDCTTTTSSSSTANRSNRAPRIIRASRNNNVINIEEDNIIDLVNDDDEVEVQETGWSCSRCTFINGMTNFQCHLCSYRNPNNNTQHSSAPVINSASGAIMGGVLGGFSASMRGRNVASGALNGAIGGAVGGALVDNLLSNFPTRSTSLTARSRSNPTSILRNPRSLTFERLANGSLRINSAGSLAAQEYVLGQMIDQGRLSYTQMEEVFGNGTENRGAEDSLIQSLPSSKITKSDEKNDCCICLDELKVGDRMRRLPCLHTFHKQCVDKWLKTNATCPICKHSIKG